MLEPFFYETVVERQSELRQAARMIETVSRPESLLPARASRFLVHRHERTTVIPCIARLLWRPR